MQEMELIEYLPEIVMWIATGFCFIKTYHFVALKQNSMDIEHILTASVVIGYIYCTIACLIPISFNVYIDNILILVSSIVVAYIIAKIVISKKMIPLLDFLHILDTGNRYMWDDLMDEKYPMKISIVCGEFRYEGIAHNVESYSNSPHIALGSYIVYNKEGQITSDYSMDQRRILVVDTSNAQKVEIIYDDKSPECEDLHDLCDYNERLRERENE